MNTSLGNMPYFCVLWMGVGFVFLIIGIFMLAKQTENETNYTGQFTEQKVEELFSFFLQEEEKKNAVLRETLVNINTTENTKGQTLKKDLRQTQEQTSEPKKHREEEMFRKVINLYEQKLAVEEIAKQLKIGVGEVKLILSLYTMR